MTLALSKFDGYLIQVLRTKDSLEREVAAVAGDNRIHREGRIKVSVSAGKIMVMRSLA